MLSRAAASRTTLPATNHSPCRSSIPQASGSRAARAAFRPGVAGDEEAVVRHIEQVEVGLEERSLDVVDLRVDADPARFGGVPELRNPVVDEPTRLEVGGEAAAGAGRRAFRTKHRHEQHGEVAADADDAVFQGARRGERTGDRDAPRARGSAPRSVCASRYGGAPRARRRRPARCARAGGDPEPCAPATGHREVEGRVAEHTHRQKSSSPLRGRNRVCLHGWPSSSLSSPPVGARPVHRDDFHAPPMDERLRHLLTSPPPRQPEEAHDEFLEHR